MTFEWDAAKAEQNVAKHGVRFELAAGVFLDLHRVDQKDDRRDYGEERRLTCGRIEGRLYSVAYTWRGELFRLISARKANDRELREYDKALHT
jgi:uncharacterized DUF497 family protein